MADRYETNPVLRSTFVGYRAVVFGEDTGQTTTSLAMPRPKALETIRAISQQLNRGLRCLLSTIGRTSSRDGLLGPDLPFCHAQKSKRHLTLLQGLVASQQRRRPAFR
jgi:lipoate-protein ligase A